ncbi:MAG TPA: hypothetical protein VHN37_15805, partial [Actinomycetota bacterium]|nr:hypothetical protein [Actinomycetota bacterium]
MADPVQGKFEVQTESGAQTRIVLEPEAAEVVAGGNGAAGDVVVNDASGEEVVRIGRINEYQGSSGPQPGAPIASYTGIRLRTSDGENLVQIGRRPSATTPALEEKDEIGVVLGGKGFSARVLIVDKDKKTRILLGQDHSDNEGRFIIQSSAGKKILEFDPDTAALYVGGGDNEGDVIVRDGGGNDRIKLDGGRGDVSVDDEDGRRLFLFDSGAAALYVGGTGNEGDVIVRDAFDRERIKLDGGDGDVWATDVKGTRVFHFDSGAAGLYVGGTGNEGDVIVRDGQNRQRIKLDGGYGDIWVDD